MASDDAGDGGLSTLFPATRSITIAGRAIELKQIGLAQGSRIAQMAAPILAVRSGSVTEWVDEHPAEANPLIVEASGLNPDWVAGLSNLDRAELASHLMEFNAGFFVQRLLPILARTGRAVAIASGDGPTFSTSSSPADTPTPATTPPSKRAFTSKRSGDGNSANAGSA